MRARETPIDLVSALAASAVVGVGIALGAGFGTTVITGLGTNLLSSLAHGRWRELRDRWLSSAEGALNHDVQRALARALKNALKDLERSYFTLGEANAMPQGDKESIRAWFRETDETSEDVLLSALSKVVTEEEVRSYLCNDSSHSEDQLLSRIEAARPLITYPDHFRSFLRRSLLPQVSVWFGEELKADNRESNKAWRAFQRMLLEGIQDTLVGIRSTQESLYLQLKPQVEEIALRLAANAATGSWNPSGPFAAALVTYQGQTRTLLTDILDELTKTSSAVESVSQKVDAVQSLQQQHSRTLGEIQTTVIRLLPAHSKLPTETCGLHDVPADIQAEFDKGDALDRVCKWADAAVHYSNAVRLAESMEHKAALFKARIELGEVLLHDKSTMERAKDVLTACLKDLKVAGGPRDRATVMHLLGHLALCQGRVQEGRALCREAVESARSCGDRFLSHIFLIDIAHAEELSGNLAEAERLLDEAASYLRVTYREASGKDRNRAGINLAGLLASRAVVYEHTGRVDEMLADLTEAETLSRTEERPDILAQSLLSKCTVLFAMSKWDEGMKALEEARGLFESLGWVQWLLKCHELRARLAFQMGDEQTALAVCMGAIAIAAEKGTAEDHGRALYRIAALCMRSDLEDAAAEFRATATRLAEEQELGELQADLLVDQADARRGDDWRSKDDEQGRGLVQQAITRLEGVLSLCEVRGRRAWYMDQIGKLYGRLGNITAAQTWFDRALSIYDEIGDTGGSAESIAMLAATAREADDDLAAIALFESVLERTRGTSFHELRAGAHHDLVRLRMGQGDIAGARKDLNAAKSICADHPMPILEDALKDTGIRLEFAERAGRPAARDLALMLRDLHGWKSRYPDKAVMILPFWFHCYGAELWSNVRSHFGVKFMVNASSTKEFDEFVDLWSSLGDLFFYSAKFPIKVEGRSIDIIPWWSDLLIPQHIPIIGIKSKRELSGKEVAEALVGVLKDTPYFVTTCDDGVCVVGRPYRVPSEILQFMMGRNCEELIAKRVLAMPAGEEGKRTLIHDMCVAWENGLLPVYSGSLPWDKQTTLHRSVSVRIPVTGERAVEARRSLRTFIGAVGANVDIALTELVGGLGDSSGLVNGIAVDVQIIAFEAGPHKVLYPAMILRS